MPGSSWQDENKNEPFVPPKQCEHCKHPFSHYDSCPASKCQSSAKISVLMVEAENVTKETMAEILRTVADFIGR